MDLNRKNKILQSAINTLRVESESLASLIPLLGDDFVVVTELILHSKGRVIITGIGKSAIVAQKVVATMNSTGTPAIFMHAADAIHGDLGLVQKHDIVIFISKSGNTPEIKVLIPLIKSSGNLLVGICGNMNSVLAKQANYLLDTTVSIEACPNNLAPTSSTTAQMAMGDTLAVALLTLRGFDSNDFAKYHPGGALGKKLYVRMHDLIDEEAIPSVEEQASLQEVIMEISSKRLGATAVLDDQMIKGIITDGDLRRMLQSGGNQVGVQAKDIMNAAPKMIAGDAMAITGFQLMKKNNISQLIVTDQGKYIGVVHLHDIIKEGIF